MRNTFRSKAWGRLAGIALSCFGAVVLTGCAAGYVHVQPNTANSGGYYTGDGPYSGRGYYDYYGTGPYYPGTGGYGYYNGTFPYFGGFGPWGDYAGDYGYLGGYPYAPTFAFNIGISNVWNYPGYWGPWYSTIIPVWSCRHGCHRHHGNGGYGHHAVATVPSSGSRPTPGQGTTTEGLATDPGVRAEKTVRTRRFVKPLPTLLPPGQFENGYRRASASYVRHGPATRAPIRKAASARTIAEPTRPMYFAHPVMPRIVDQHAQRLPDPAPGPRDFSAPPHRAYGAPVPKLVNRGALTRNPPTAVYRHSTTHARSSAYRPAVPVTSSSSHGHHAHKPRIH